MHHCLQLYTCTVIQAASSTREMSIMMAGLVWRWKLGLAFDDIVELCSSTLSARDSDSPQLNKVSSMNLARTSIKARYLCSPLLQLQLIDRVRCLERIAIVYRPLLYLPLCILGFHYARSMTG